METGSGNTKFILWEFTIGLKIKATDYRREKYLIRPFCIKLLQVLSL